MSLYNLKYKINDLVGSSIFSPMEAKKKADSCLIEAYEVLDDMESRISTIEKKIGDKNG